MGLIQKTFILATKDLMSDIFLFHPTYSQNNFYDFHYSLSIHTQPCLIYQSDYCQKWIWVTICQTDLILTRNCVIVSRWVHNLIWQAYINCPKSVYTFCRPNEKRPKFGVSLQHQRFTIYSLMVFSFEKFLTDKSYLG